MTDSVERDGDCAAAIEARLKAATPGEWICAPWSTGIVGPAAWCPNKGTCVAVVKNDRDKNFIAHAPEDVAWLLAELGRVRAERDAACDALKESALMPYKPGDDPAAYPCWCQTFGMHEGAEKEHEAQCARKRAVLGLASREVRLASRGARGGAQP